MKLTRLQKTAASLRVMIDPWNPLRPQEAEEIVGYYEGWVQALIERLEAECGSTETLAAALVARADEIVTQAMNE